MTKEVDLSVLSVSDFCKVIYAIEKLLKESLACLEVAKRHLDDENIEFWMNEIESLERSMDIFHSCVHQKIGEESFPKESLKKKEA